MSKKDGTHPMVSWPMVYLSHRADIDSFEHIVPLFIHWRCLTHNLLCEGFHESNDSETSKSDILPKQWSKKYKEKKLTLSYCNKEDGVDVKYTVQFSKVFDDKFILVNLLDISNKNVFSTTIDISDVSESEASSSSDFKYTFKDLRGMINKTDEDIFNKLNIESKNHVASQTSNQSDGESSRQTPSRSSVPLLESGSHHHPSIFPSIGSSDLDPLGRGSQGMIFDPSRPGGHPLPRFDGPSPLRNDPLFPNMPLRRGGQGRNPGFGDELPPPGWNSNDNMFM